MTGTIYGLVDPNSGYVRYIGRTTRAVAERVVEHGHDHRRYRTHCANWIRALYAAGQTFGVTILEDGIALESLDERECWWIAFGRGFGWPLTNLTDGGDGHLGHSPSLEVRAKISRTLTGHGFSAETIEKVRAAKMTPEALARMCGDSNIAKRADIRLKISKNRTGKGRKS